MPLAISSSVETDAFMSEPEISIPMRRRTRPRGRIDTPPMPTRWQRLPGTRYCSICWQEGYSMQGSSEKFGLRTRGRARIMKTDSIILYTEDGNKTRRISDFCREDTL